MNEKDIKKAFSHITMNDDMAKRICYNLKEKNCTKKTQPKRYRSILAVAAIAAICILGVGAGAAYHYLFNNPTIVKDHDEINTIIEETRDSISYGKPVIAVQMPNSKETFSIEEMIETYTRKSSAWSDESTKGGSIRSDDEWKSMVVTDNEGDMRSRSIYSVKGAVKEEFTAVDPSMLQDKINGDLIIDLNSLNNSFDFIPDANVLYTITEKNGKYAGMYLATLYSGLADGSYFTIEYSHDVNSENESSASSYITESDYDKAYYYTNADGIEFVITTYGECSWADCSTDNSNFILYGGHLSTQEVEKVLDCVTLSEKN